MVLIQPALQLCLHFLTTRELTTDHGSPLAVPRPLPSVTRGQAGHWQAAVSAESPGSGCCLLVHTQQLLVLTLRTARNTHKGPPAATGRQC